MFADFAIGSIDNRPVSGLTSETLGFPQTAPSRLHSGVGGCLLVYRCGGSTGMADVKVARTGFPFHPRPRKRRRHLLNAVRLSVCAGEVKRFVVGGMTLLSLGIELFSKSSLRLAVLGHIRFVTQCPRARRCKWKWQQFFLWCYSCYLQPRCWGTCGNRSCENLIGP